MKIPAGFICSLRLDSLFQSSVIHLLTKRTFLSAFSNGHGSDNSIVIDWRLAYSMGMKFLIQIIGLGLVCYCLIGAVLYVFQEKMLFFPMGPGFGKCLQMERFGAKAIKINGIRYYLKSSENPENWIIVFHGNAGSACDRVYFFDLLTETRSNIVLFEYPGYGGDGSTPGEKIILEKALELVTHIQGGAKDNLPIYLLGESLGTGVATWVSTQKQVSGLILISAYTAIVDVARHHYPWLPVRYLLKHQFQASVWAGRTRTPAILFHGIDDDIIPVEFARRQVKNFNSKAVLFEIDHCGHNDIVDTASLIIKKKIDKFMASD